MIKSIDPWWSMGKKYPWIWSTKINHEIVHVIVNVRCLDFHHFQLKKWWLVVRNWWSIMKSVVPYATHDHQSLGWWRPRKCWVHTLWVSKNTLPVVIGLQELAELQSANLEFVGNHKPVHMSQRPSFLIRSSFLKLMVSRSQCWWDKSLHILDIVEKIN